MAPQEIAPRELLETGGSNDELLRDAATESAARPTDVVDEIERAKQRLERDSKREVERKTRAILESFLDVVDDMDRALAGADALGEADRALLDGVAMVRDRFIDKLAAQGVERDSEVGDAFDPSRHEALATAPASQPSDEGTIVAVVRPGYRIGDDVLRPAGVVVATRDR